MFLHGCLRILLLLSPLLLFSLGTQAQWSAVRQMVVEFTGYGGSGADGALVIDGLNGPNNPLYTDNVRTRTTSAISAGATAINVASIAGFNSGDEILIIQMLGTNAGRFETATISGAPAGSTINLSAGLKYAYPAHSAGTNVTQVIAVPNYSSLTINSGGYLTAHGFNGETGGVLFFRSSGNVTINYNATYSGRIVMDRKGFGGGTAGAVGSGPGGGSGGATGGGGANTSPVSDMYAIMGSGGGGGTAAGGDGGGVIMFKTSGTLRLDGVISANGETAAAGNAGGGSGGTILITANNVTKTTTCGPLRATGGSGNGSGGAGGNGRILIKYGNTLGCSNGSPSAASSYQKFILK